VDQQSVAWMPGPTLRLLIPAFLSRWIAGALYTQVAAVLLSPQMRALPFAMPFSMEPQAGVVPLRSAAEGRFSRIARFRISPRLRGLGSSSDPVLRARS